MTPELRQWVDRATEGRTSLSSEQLEVLRTMLLRNIEFPEGRSLIASAIVKSIDHQVSWIEERVGTHMPSVNVVDTLHRLYQQCGDYLSTVPKEELAYRSLPALVEVSTRIVKLVESITGTPFNPRGPCKVELKVFRTRFERVLGD